MKNTENENEALNKTAVSSSDFRIVEYKDHFRIEKKQIVEEWVYFFGVALWLKEQKVVWNCILKDKSYLSYRNFIETEKYKYQTKEECLEWICDFNKYPLYHYC